MKKIENYNTPFKNEKEPMKDDDLFLLGQFSYKGKTNFMSRSQLSVSRVSLFLRLEKSFSASVGRYELKSGDGTNKKWEEIINFTTHFVAQIHKLFTCAGSFFSIFRHNEILYNT